jgi:hypothetical protein
MLDWRHLARLPDAELVRLDIAAVNLACAEGLPGADEIDVDYCLYKLDYAEAVRSYTLRLMPQFRRKPHEYEDSEAYFRALAMITALQRDLGVRYNPAKIPEDAPFETADSFIHGVIPGDGGTCATLPVVYAAVGRRLGYPIRLVSTRGKKSGHLFCRWDDPATGERFNIEAAGRGLTTPGDDYFRAGLYDLSPQAEAEGCHLRSMTPRMELAGFLGDRAWRWEDVGDWWRCVDSWAWAAALVPENVHKRNSLKRCMVEWDKEQGRKKPAGFPAVLVRANARQFPDSLPLDLEQNICGLTAVHHMLTDPRLEGKYWGRMRRGDYDRAPTVAVADFAADTSCRIHLRFD